MHICMHMRVYSNIYISRTRVHGFTCQPLEHAHAHAAHAAHAALRRRACACTSTCSQCNACLSSASLCSHSMLRATRQRRRGRDLLHLVNGGRARHSPPTGAAPARWWPASTATRPTSLARLRRRRARRRCLRRGGRGGPACRRRARRARQARRHVAVAFDRRGADPWRQLLKMAATLISNGATGCQISGLYHPALLAATDAQVNGPPSRSRSRRPASASRSTAASAAWG